MVERYSDPDGDTVVAHQGNIWRFDVDSLDSDLLADIKSQTGLDDIENWDDLREEVLDNRPDVFIGQITDDGFLQNASYNEFTHGQNSPLIKKIVQFYKLKGYRAPDTEDDVGEEFSKHELTGMISDYAYHGTNLMALESIIKFGLNPSKENATNWGFSFSDKIYLTTKENYGIYHANNSARNQKSHPILIRVKIPDKNRITADYDVAKTFGMKDVSDQEGYTGIISKHTYDYDIRRTNKIQTHSPKTDFNKVSGVFAYKGRIPASFISWIGFKNNYEGLSMDDRDAWLSTDNMQIIHDKTVWSDFVEMMNQYGFYDPVYLDELRREEEDYD